MATFTKICTGHMSEGEKKGQGYHFQVFQRLLLETREARLMQNMNTIWKWDAMRLAIWLCSKPVFEFPQKIARDKQTVQ